MDYNFQTPPDVARYICSMIPDGTVKVLEPTPGIGNIVKFLEAYEVITPEDFFQMQPDKFDCIVMNPPFSAKSAFGMPEGKQFEGMKLGYHILTECMKMSDHIIALMPWFTISDQDVRLRMISRFGLKSITALPRKTFEYARIQTCILELEKGFKGDTNFIVYDTIKNENQLQLINN